MSRIPDVRIANAAGKVEKVELFIIKSGNQFSVIARGGNNFYKTLDDFVETFDAQRKLSQALHQQAFDLYKAGQWQQLEQFFAANNINKVGNISWPPANGGFNIVDDVTLAVGVKFDRYGNALGSYNGQGVPVLGGKFTSPIPAAGKYTYGQRALVGAENGYDFYYEIEVVKQLPFKGQTADVIPWHGQVGYGKQTMWKIPVNTQTSKPFTWNELAQQGYI